MKEFVSLKTKISGWIHIISSIIGFIAGIGLYIIINTNIQSDSILIQSLNGIKANPQLLIRLNRIIFIALIIGFIILSFDIGFFRSLLHGDISKGFMIFLLVLGILGVCGQISSYSPIPDELIEYTAILNLITIYGWINAINNILYPSFALDDCGKIANYERKRINQLFGNNDDDDYI